MKTARTSAKKRIQKNVKQATTKTSFPQLSAETLVIVASALPQEAGRERETAQSAARLWLHSVDLAGAISERLAEGDLATAWELAGDKHASLEELDRLQSLAFKKNAALAQKTTEVFAVGKDDDDSSPLLLFINSNAPKDDHFKSVGTLRRAWRTVWPTFPLGEEATEEQAVHFLSLRGKRRNEQRRRRKLSN